MMKIVSVIILFANWNIVYTEHKRFSVGELVNGERSRCLALETLRTEFSRKSFPNSFESII